MKISGDVRDCAEVNINIKHFYYKDESAHFSTITLKSTPDSLTMYFNNSEEITEFIGTLRHALVTAKSIITD